MAARQLLALACMSAIGGACQSEPPAETLATALPLLCGQVRPEDLVRIPGTRWLIASGFSDGAGLKLVDTTGRSLSSAYSGVAAEVRPDTGHFPDCSDPPEPRLLNVQGLSLRHGRNGRHTLYAVNHGGRESVEAFEVDATRNPPSLTWQGCVRLPPDLAANSVASYSDGTLLITVLVHPGDTYADFVEGRDTGGVYQWTPGADGFELLPGTELPGNNGLETAADDSAFYVVAFGRHSIFRYSRDNFATPVEAVAPGFMPDNIHRDDGRFITAGMVYDEPACGGLRKVVDGKADDMRCHRGTVVAELDPDEMSFRILASAPPDPVFNGASAALLADNTVWLGSYQSDCLAYLALPSLP